MSTISSICKQGGIWFCKNDEHMSLESSKLFIDEGNTICDNDKFLFKTISLISSTDERIIICDNDGHPSKAWAPILSIDEEIVICVNDEQHRKA